MKELYFRNYQHTKAKYLKFSKRLKRSIENGNFYSLSHQKQFDLIERVKKLFQKLKELQLWLKLAAAGSSMVLVLNTGSVFGQKAFFKNKPDFINPDTFQKKAHKKSAYSSKYGSFVLYLGNQNPFLSKNPFSESRTEEGWAAFSDLDNDGDLDLVLTSGDYYSDENRIIYYRNNGSVENGVLEEYTGDDNPFMGIAINDNYALQFIDIDNDGDQDLFLTDEEEYSYYFTGGKIRYFKNTGTIENPEFEEQPDADNPFHGQEFLSPGGFNFTDIDNDGDYDMFIGDLRIGEYTWGRSFRFFKNTGTASDAAFEEFVDDENPLSAISNYFSIIPAFADMDGDGDYDAVIGSYSYNPIYLKNQGTAENPVFIQQEGSDNPFEPVDLGYYGHFNPFIMDYDEDGDNDVLYHNGLGEIKYYKNSGTPQQASLHGENGFDLYRMALPEFADMDNDGDLDLIVGTFLYFHSYDESSLRYYKNTGTENQPAFEEQYYEDNPFLDLDAGIVSFPEMIDIDADGDMDLFNMQYVEDEYYRIVFYKNTGTAQQAVFEEQSPELNPLNVLQNEYIPLINFADIDNDGDYDCLVGSYAENNGDYLSVIKWYKNTGNQYNAEFVYESNPVSVQLVEDYLMIPEIADIDGDGDYDCMGLYYDYLQQGRALLYFKNVGTMNEPDFALQTDAENPFSDILHINELLYPTFADLDSDADNDLFIGTFDGFISYYKNTMNSGLITQTNLSETICEGESLTMEGIQFSDEGIYEMMLSDQQGNDSVIMMNLTIDSPPVAGFTYQANGLEVSFYNASINAGSYNWNFGDGNSAFTYNAIHTYDSTGNYLVTLEAISDHCGIAADSQYVSVITSAYNIESDNRVKVYPVPAKGLVNIDIDHTDNQIITVGLFNNLGRLIETYNIEPGRILLDVNHLPAGLYVVKIKQGERATITKIIKK